MFHRTNQVYCSGPIDLRVRSFQNFPFSLFSSFLSLALCGLSKKKESNRDSLSAPCLRFFPFSGHSSEMWFLALGLAVLVAGDAGSYVNPVLARDFPDPCVIRAQTGTFYAYGTMSGGLHIQVAQSADLVNWSYLGEALPNLPGWWIGPNTWAPDVSFFNGSYYMYYGGSGSMGMCIGVAVSATPEGPFVDVGAPVMCDINFTDIDPKLYVDPSTGVPYLFWGSDFAPLQVQALAPNRTAVAAGSQPTALIYPNASQPYASLVEGTWIWPNPGAQQGYFLYYSGNNCCGTNAEYAVMVAHSANLTGPYETLSQATGSATSVILQLNSQFVAPGHNSVLTDDAGQDWMFYHAYQGSERDARVLMMDRIFYNLTAAAWPFVGTPSFSPQPAPVVNSESFTSAR
eukprot:m.252225 g.252225  ORF g.252225 m.252225 type:complete len:401 (+) comp54517_c0_seq9:634-1836(+)